MAVYWTEEPLDDPAQILAYYYLEAGSATAGAVERCIVTQIENLASFPKRIRKIDRIPRAREFVVSRLPDVAVPAEDSYRTIAFGGRRYACPRIARWLR